MMVQRGASDYKSPRQSNWFECLSRSKAPRLRVFCFPHAGGSADLYRSWQRWFPEQLDLCLVHLPGRGKNMDTRAFSQLVPLVAEILDHISLLTDIPYALYGHSMGALISFELARELSRRQRNGPKHLFVSGCRAPQYPRDEPITFNLPHDAFIAELKKLNGTPEEVLANSELMELFIDVLRADFEAVETYKYQPGGPLSCPITVYGGIEDEHVPVEACRQWQEQTSATCKVRMFSGNHFFVRNAGPEFINVFRTDLLSAATL
jgi:medium-chain acyl-[acyl-carrier-protein] hydrolase